MEKGNTSIASASRDANLRRYCTMGIGTAVLVGAVTTMDASVVYTNFGNTVLTDTSVGDGSPTEYGVYLGSNGTFNLSGNGTNVANFFVDTEAKGSAANFAVLTAGATPIGTSSFTVNPLNVVGKSTVASMATYRYPSRLAAGVSVGPSQKFITLGGTAGGELQGGSLAFGAGFTGSQFAKTGKNSGYLGISFNDASGALHYGFIDITVASNGATTNARAITLIDGGYQTTANTAINTAALPAVPEPTSLALLAAGGLGGVAAFRRRRNQAAVLVS